MAGRAARRTMLGMTTPIVTELPLRLEPITADPFAESLHAAAGRSDHVMNYVECDLADEVTLPHWRRARATDSRRHSFRIRSVFAPQRREAALA